MLTKALFAKWMATLHKRFSKEADEHVVQLYYEHVEQMTDTEFETAARHIFTKDEYWPSPDRFIQLAHGTTKDAAQREWAILLDACNKNNTNPALTPAGMTAMRRIGGWREIAYAEGLQKQEALRRRFIAAYETETQTLPALANGTPLLEA